VQCYHWRNSEQTQPTTVVETWAMLCSPKRGHRRKSLSCDKLDQLNVGHFEHDSLVYTAHVSHLTTIDLWNPNPSVVFASFVQGVLGSPSIIHPNIIEQVGCALILNIDQQTKRMMIIQICNWHCLVFGLLEKNCIQPIYLFIVATMNAIQVLPHPTRFLRRLVPSLLNIYVFFGIYVSADACNRIVF